MQTSVSPTVLLSETAFGSVVAPTVDGDEDVISQPDSMDGNAATPAVQVDSMNETEESKPMRRPLGPT